MRGSPVTFRDFSGGVNQLDAPYNLKDNEARDARNVVSVQRVIRKRAGSQVWAATGAAPQSMYASPLPNFLIVAGGTSLFSVSPGKEIVSLATGLANAVWDFANAPTSGGQGPIWGMNGSQARYTNGSTVGTGTWTASTGTLPIGQFLVYIGNRLFVAGMTSYASVVDPRSALVWSNLANPRDWPAANVVLLDPNDGEAISGIGVYNSQLLVFKPSKIWLINDLNTGANRLLTKGAGCVAARSIVETPYGTFFLSKDHGVMRTNGQTVERMSDRIKPLLDSISQAQRGLAVGAFWMDHYYLSISLGGTRNDTLLDFDCKTGAWWIHTLGEADIAVWEPGSGPLLYGAKAGDAAGNVRQLFVSGLNQDDVPAVGGAGTSFVTYWSGPFHDLRHPEVRKRLKQVRLDGRGRVQVSLAKDFSRNGELRAEQVIAGDTTLFGVNDGSLYSINDGTIFGGAADVAQMRVMTPGVARVWSVILGNATADPLEIDSYTFSISPRKD